MTSPTMQALRMRSSAWYGDRELLLDVPANWDVETFWPRTPEPLSDAEIAALLESPIGRPPVRDLARGKTRPVIVVDDLTRPTPADRALPHLLRHLEAAGISAAQVTVVIGGGTHRPATQEQALRKLGAAGRACRIAVHQQNDGVVRIGRTSFGTPVLVNSHVAASDLLIGIGGVYPQHSVGFGGGSKLLLGVLGRRSIMSLHYGHSSVAGTYDIDNDFRRDLDEMMRLVPFDSIVTLHVNANREVVRAVSGDHHRYYREAVAFSRSAYAAPLPGDADVVIANAYPMDVSLTFARSKGLAPLYRAKPEASRVLVAACSEGLGHHGLFPFLDGPRFEKQIHRLRRLSVVRPEKVPGKVGRRLVGLGRRMLRPRTSRPRVSAVEGTITARNIWLHTSQIGAAALPTAIPGMIVKHSWGEIVAEVEHEQGSNRPLRVAVYPCSPLHCLDLSGAETHDHLATASSRAK